MVNTCHDTFVKTHKMYNAKSEPCRDTDVENKRMDPKAGKWRAGGGGGMNWEIGIDMYTLICIKWISNKNLLYKKIN